MRWWPPSKGECSPSHLGWGMCGGEDKRNTHMLARLARPGGACTRREREWSAIISFSSLRGCIFFLLFCFAAKFSVCFWKHSLLKTLNNPVHGARQLAAWSPDMLLATYPVRLYVMEIMQVSWLRVLLSLYKSSRHLLATHRQKQNLGFLPPPL